MSAMEPPRSKQLWDFGLVIMLLMCQSMCSGVSRKRMIRREPTDRNWSEDALSKNNSAMDTYGVIHRASRRDTETSDHGYISNGERSEGGNKNNFQVPKSLCSACEKFPWTPVAGAEYVRNNVPQFPHQQPGSQQQPTAPGSGGSLDVGSANRKPFAVFSDIRNGNAIFPNFPRPLDGSVPANQLPQYGTPVNPTNLRQYSRPSVQGQIDQSFAFPLPISSLSQQPSPPATVTQYVRPTVLQPASPSYVFPQQTTRPSDGSSQEDQSQISTLQIQDVEQAQLIYQEHSQQQGNPTDAPSNQYGPPVQLSPLPHPPQPPFPLGLARPQNFRIPSRPFLGRPVNQFRFPPRLNYPMSPKGNAARFVNRPIQLSLPGPPRPFVSTQGYNPPSVVVQSSYGFPPSAPPTTSDFSVSGPSPQGNSVLTGPARQPPVQYGATPPPPMANNGPSLLPPSFSVQNTPSAPPPSPTQNAQLLSAPQQISALPPQPSVQYGPPSPDQGFPLPPNPKKNVHSPIPPPVQQNYQIPFSAGVPLLQRPSQGVRLLHPPQQNVPSSPQSPQPVPSQPNPPQGVLYMLPPKDAAPSIPQPLPQLVPLAPTQPLDASYIPPSPTGPPSIPAQQLVQTGTLQPLPSGQYLPPKVNQETHPDAQLPQDQTLKNLGHQLARPPPLSTYLPPTPPKENPAPELNHPLPHVQNAPVPPPLVPYSSVGNAQGQVQNEQDRPQGPPPPAQIQLGGYEPAVPPPPPQYLDLQPSLQSVANELPPPGMLEMRPPPPPPRQIDAIAPIFLHSGSLFPQPPTRPLLFPTNQFTPPAGADGVPSWYGGPLDQPQQTEQQKHQQVLPASDSLVIPGSQLPPDYIVQQSHQPEPQYEGIPQHLIQMFPPPPTIQGQATQNIPQLPPLGIAQGIVNGQPVNYDSLVPVQSIEVASFETNSLPAQPPIASPELIGDSVQQPIQGPVMNLLESIIAGPEATTPNPYRVEVRGQQIQDSVHIEYLPASTIDIENPDDSKSTPNEAKNRVPNDNQNLIFSPQITQFSPHISTIVDNQSTGNNGAQQEQPSESVDEDQIHVGGALTEDSAVDKSVPSKFLRNNGNWETVQAKQYDISHLFHNPQHDFSAPTGPSNSDSAQNGQSSVSVDQVSPTITPQDYSIQAAQNNEIGTVEVNVIPVIHQGSNNKTTDDQIHEQQTSDESSEQSSQVTFQEHYGGSQEVSHHFPISSEHILAASNHPSQVTSGNSIQEKQDGTSKTTDGPLSVGIPILESAESTLDQGSQFDPMPSAVENALHHAEQTSFLQHTHMGDDTPKGTVYIESFPVIQENSSSSSNDNNVGPAPTKTTALEQGENGIVLTNALRVDGAYPGATVITPFNCSGGHMAFEVGQDGQTIVKAYPVQTHPDFYRPTPHSSVYWAEQPSSETVTKQGAQSQLHSDGDDKQSSSSFLSQTSYSSPVFGWSPQLIQTSSAINPDASLNHIAQTQKRQQQESLPPTVSATVGSLDDSSVSQSYPSRSTDSSGMFKAIETTTKPSIFSRRPLFSRPSFFRPSISAGRSKDAESQPLQESTSSTTPKYALFADGNSMKVFRRLKMPKTVTTASSASSSTSTTEIPAIAMSSTFGTTTAATLFVVPSSKKSYLKNGKPEKIRITVGTRFNAGAFPTFSNVLVQTGTAASSTETTKVISTSDASDISSISSALPTVPTYLGTGKYGNRIQQQGNKSRAPTASTATAQSMHSLGLLNSLSDEADLAKPAGKKRAPESSALLSNEDSIVLDSQNSLVSNSSQTDFSQKIPISTTDFPLSSSPRMVINVVKTVRVRKRMRSGGNATTPQRRRLPGRVRVVQRPILRKQLKESQTMGGEDGNSSALESVTPEGEALGKEEEVEVKNALIDLKKISV